VTAIENDVVRGRHGPIPIRRYRPQTPVAGADPLVWLHGGAFSYGGLDQPESHAPALALAATGRPVVAVDYRRVPRRRAIRKTKPRVLEGIRFPIPLEDVLDTVDQICSEAAHGRIVLGGASAGACLAAAATLRLIREKRPGPAALVLAYGTFHADLPPIKDELRARIRGRHAIFQFRPQTVERMNHNYAGRPEAMADATAFPGGHDLSGFPPSLLVDADRDSLRASGGAFAAELDSFNVPVDYEIVAEAPHGFLNRPESGYFATGMATIGGWLARTTNPARQPATHTTRGAVQ
jgi:xylan 1,4-beta-xylosidase